MWKAVCYPDGFIDAVQKRLYVTVDTYCQQFLLKTPLAKIL
jgi:hypothetical protein